MCIGARLLLDRGPWHCHLVGIVAGFLPPVTSVFALGIVTSGGIVVVATCIVAGIVAQAALLAAL